MKNKIMALVARVMMVAGICVSFTTKALADSSTVTASKIASSSASWKGSANETWSVSVNGGATNQNVTNGYAQVGTSSSPSTSMSFSTTGINGTITSIVVNCAAYQGKASLSATVGGAAFGTQSQSVPSWSSNAGGNVTFSGSASGAIVITMTNGSNGKAMYIKSITVTYTTNTSYTVTYDPNGGAGEMTDPDNPYNSGATVTVLSNIFTREHYNFSKWNTAANGSGQDYSAGVTFTINKNTTLYAQWTLMAVATTTSVNAAGITNTDVYVATDAGSLSATVKDNNDITIKGATITWSGDNPAVATINESTGAVTLVGTGSVTFTASYAGVVDEYQSSSATYQMTVTSSAPQVQPTEFDINLNNSLFGTTYNGSVANITDSNPIVGSQNNVSVTYAGSGNHYVNNSQIRFYPSNKLSFEAPSGYKFKSIVFTADGTWAATISADSGTYTSSTKTWTGSATSVVFTGSGSSRCDMSKAAIKLEQISTVPSISADDVNIDYDATNGNIAFTVTNPVEDGVVSASTEATWITIGEVGDNSVPFTCSANLGNERSAYITLTYTYNTNETVTKDVKITQGANEDIPVVPEGDKYKLFSGDLVEGDYIIYYAGYAMKNAKVSGKNRLDYELVTPDNDLINTSDASIIWHIAKSGDYWTLYNASVEAFAAATNSKNEAQMITDGSDSKALWTVEDTFEFINKARDESSSDSGNKYLRNNGTNGFACYSSSTGGALSLYKLNTPDTEESINATEHNGLYWATFYSGVARYKLPEGTRAYTMDANHKLYLLGTDGSVIPAGTAVIIISDIASPTITQIPNVGVVAINGGENILRGSSNAVTVSVGTPYVMGINSNTLGFYKFTGSEIPAGKAYYVTE